MVLGHRNELAAASITIVRGIPVGGAGHSFSPSGEGRANHICIVLIPDPRGERYDYDIDAASSMKAARIALQRHHEPVPDSALLIAIIDGHSLRTFDCVEHNAKQPTYRHRAGTVRAGR
jgi:hypothetical protein